MKAEKWLQNKNLTLKDKTVVLTGATGIIGTEIAKYLIGLNANLIITARNLNSGSALKEKLVKLYPNSNISVMKLDVSSINSINDFVEELNKANININYLINNAGIYNVPFSLTKDQFEIHYATNFIGPMYLTLKLLPLLNKNLHSKVIFQSSLSANFNSVDWNNPQSLNEKNKIKLYSITKKLLNLSVIGINEKLSYNNFKNVSFSLAHPGVCSTNIIHYKNGGYSKWFYYLAKNVLNVVCHSPKTASLGIILAIFDNDCNFSWYAPRGVYRVWGKPKKYNLHSKIYSQENINKTLELLKADLQPFDDEVNAFINNL